MDYFQELHGLLPGDASGLLLQPSVCPTTHASRLLLLHAGGRLLLLPRKQGGNYVSRGGLLSQEEEQMHHSLEWINSSPYIITMYKLLLYIR